MIVPQRNPTLPWADIQCKVKWDRRAPKPQYRWSFPQINLHTVTTLNQYLHIFSKFFWVFEQCPIQPLWVLGMRCLHLPVRALSKVLLLPVWVWLVLPSTAYSKGMLPLDLWCQASLQGLLERQHLGKTVHCWGWSHRIVSWVLGPWRRGWEICTEWGLVAQRLTTDSCPVVTGHIDPQRSPCWLPTTVVSAWSGRRGGGTWQWPTGSMSSSVMSRDSNFTRVRRLPGERFRPGCQAHRVQAGGGSVHVWGAFHNSAKSPLVLPDGYLTGVLYRGILQNTRYWPGPHKTRPPGSVTKKIIFVRPNLPQLSSSDI